jgi:hypothetical protein
VRARDNVPRCQYFSLWSSGHVYVYLLKMIVLGDLLFRWGFENLLELLLWSFILWSSCYYFTSGLVFYGTCTLNLNIGLACNIYIYIYVCVY